MLSLSFIVNSLSLLLALWTSSVAAGSGIKYESKDGKLYADSKPVNIKGAVWVGMASRERVVRGLWDSGGTGGTTIPKALDLLEKNKFNGLRLGLAMNLILEDPVSKPDQVGGSPDLVGKKYLEVLDEIIFSAAKRNIVVALVNQKIENTDEDHTLPWFTDSDKKEKIESALKKLATRYCGVSAFWNILGIDLQEKPRESTWASGNKTSDWNTAAEDLGNKVLSYCPEWLIFVQGTDRKYLSTQVPTAGQLGAVLQGVTKAPITLTDMKKLVYSPHFNGIFGDDSAFWKTSDFPENMPAVWDEYFGFIPGQTKQALVVGAWGERMDTDDKRKKQWQEKFVEYLNDASSGTFYNGFNYDGGNVDGLVTVDWVSPNTEKLDVLAKLKSTDFSSLVDGKFTCSEDSECIYGDCKEGVCSCSAGWEGKLCDYCKDQSKCAGGAKCTADSECGNGVCKDEDERCHCAAGFSGLSCDSCTDGGKESCNDNGKCSEGKCTCSRGYDGAKCEIDLCKETDCGSSSAICDMGQCVCRFECVGNDCTSCSKDGSSGKSCGECPNASSSAVAPVFSVLCALVALSVGAKTEFIF